ncbi:hypothetical protein JCM8208_001268 [Rhodotorula glutinis]
MPPAHEEATQASIGPIEGVEPPPPVDPPSPSSHDSHPASTSGPATASTLGTPIDRRSSTITLHDGHAASTGASGSGRARREKQDEPTARSADAAGDVEKGRRDGDETDEDTIVVDWKGKDDPACPLNWTKGRRTLATLCVAGFTLLAPLSSSMMAPASGQVAAKLDITSSLEQEMTVSIFVLGFAVGPLFWGPASEIFGRIRVLQLANLLYLIFNLVCAWAPNKAAFIVFRFIGGLGGGAPLSVGAGVLSDLWRAEERGKGAALYSLGPLLGPALGPVMGAWIVDKVPNDGYRWIFISTTIFSALVQLIGLVGLRETYGPVLLRQQAAAIKKNMGLPPDSDRVQTIHEVKSGRKSYKSVVVHGMLRPFALIATEPIIQLFTAYLSLIYGTIYLVLTTTSAIYRGVYGQSVGISGLHYLSLALGFMIASQGGARYLDVIYRKLTAKEGKGRPEFRLPLVVPASFLLPLGLLMYGWGAEKRIHWIFPDIGLVFLGFSMIIIFQSSTSYLIDLYTLHAASALAATICFRSMAGCFFPWFAQYMYDGIGYGWGCTILAGVAIIIGWPSTPLLWFYGERIRSRSRYVAKAAAK